MANTEQPKKSKSAYFLWLDENRSAIVEELGTAKGSEVTKKAGEKWKALLPELKQPFEEKAASLKKEYDENLQTFKEGGGVVARKSKKDHEDKKAKKARKEAMKDAPKKPAGGGYGVYLTENREEIKKGLPADHKITDVSKVAGARWKALTEAEQKPYSEKFRAKQSEYKVAFAEFQAARRGSDENEADKVAESPPAKPASKKRACVTEESSKKEAKVKSAKRGRTSKVTPQIDIVKLDQDILEAAQGLKMEGALKNLASRSEIVALNLPSKKILEALKSAEGLVNKAKSALMGA